MGHPTQIASVCSSSHVHTLLLQGPAPASVRGEGGGESKVLDTVEGELARPQPHAYTHTHTQALLVQPKDIDRLTEMVLLL